jgi:hypothetical protein
MNLRTCPERCLDPGGGVRADHREYRFVPPAGHAAPADLGMA